MRILNDKESILARKYLDACVKMAKKSLCLRGHCGAVIVKNGKIIGKGFNSPPQNNVKFRTCSREYEIPAGFRHDRTCCIHAEQRAIANASSLGNSIKGAIIYFTRCDEKGNRVASHRLCCTICSRAVLDAGIKEFVLEWEDGSIRSWPADEFNKLSYEYKTPIIK